MLENGADIHAANKVNMLLYAYDYQLLTCTTQDGFTPYALASQGPYADTATFAMKYATASPSHEDTKPSKLRIFDLENAQKDKEDGSLTDFSPYDSMTAGAKSDKGSKL